MEQIDFCDKYCPMPMRWVEFPRIDNKITVDCDLEASDCPFKDVNYEKVTAYKGAKNEWWVKFE